MHCDSSKSQSRLNIQHIAVSLMIPEVKEQFEVAHLLFLVNTVRVMKTGIVSRNGHLERWEQKRNFYNIQCQ
jgi:hypothetical protein